jgi:hypothetical protein
VNQGLCLDEPAGFSKRPSFPNNGRRIEPVDDTIGPAATQGQLITSLTYDNLETVAPNTHDQGFMSF